MRITAPYGYYVGNGYLGYAPDLRKMILFPTEKEYYEYLKDEESN